MNPEAKRKMQRRVGAMENVCLLTYTSIKMDIKHEKKEYILLFKI